MWGLDLSVGGVGGRLPFVSTATTRTGAGAGADADGDGTRLPARDLRLAAAGDDQFDAPAAARRASAADASDATGGAPRAPPLGATWHDPVTAAAELGRVADALGDSVGEWVVGDQATPTPTEAWHRLGPPADGALRAPPSAGPYAGAPDPPGAAVGCYRLALMAGTDRPRGPVPDAARPDHWRGRITRLTANGSGRVAVTYEWRPGEVAGADPDAGLAAGDGWRRNTSLVATPRSPPTASFDGWRLLGVDALVEWYNRPPLVLPDHLPLPCPLYVPPGDEWGLPSVDFGAVGEAVLDALPAGPGDDRYHLHPPWQPGEPLAAAGTLNDLPTLPRATGGGGEADRGADLPGDVSPWVSLAPALRGAVDHGADGGDGNGDAGAADGAGRGSGGGGGAGADTDTGGRDGRLGRRPPRVVLGLDDPASTDASDGED